MTDNPYESPPLEQAETQRGSAWPALVGLMMAVGIVLSFFFAIITAAGLFKTVS